MPRKLLSLIVCSLFILNACQQNPSNNKQQTETQEISNLLIPTQLMQNLPGEDADVFIIFDNNSYIKTGLAQLKNQNTETLSKIKTGVMLANSKNQTIHAIIEFYDNNSAVSGQKLIDDYIKEQGITNNEKLKYQSEVNQDLVSFSIKNGDQGLLGNFSDNQAYKKLLNSKYLDKELIIYFDNNRNPEIMMGAQLLFTLASSNMLDQLNGTKTAETDSNSIATISSSIAPKRSKAIEALNDIISYSQETIITVRPLTNLYLNLEITFPDPNSLDKTAIFNHLKEISPEGNQPKLADFQANYQDSLTILKESISELNFEPTNANHKTSVKTTFDNNKLNLLLTIPMVEIQKIMAEAPIKARDAQRLADLNRLINRIEIYNSDSGKYPEKSSCIENLEIIKDYFVKEKIPSDPNGPQIFGTETCQSGYYYLACPDGDNLNYSIWTKAELTENGNTNTFPSTENPSIITGKTGIYKVINEGCPESLGTIDETESLNTQPAKVKRLKNI